MATIAPKILADGQLPAAKGTLYTVPASTSIYVKAIICQNTGGGNNTVTLYFKPGATSRRVARAVLATNETLYFDESIALETGDLIEGDATNATQVDYVIMGATEV